MTSLQKVFFDMKGANFVLKNFQNTVTRDGREVELRGKGRHDPCVLPRAVPMVEAMMALTLVDHLMMQKAQCELFPNVASLEDQPNPLGKTARRVNDLRKHPVEVIKSGPVSQRVDEE
jgi:Chorismate synthase